MKKAILILGGARSGKSSYAELLASSENGNVLYVATAEAKDKEMAERIYVHRSRRPVAWKTLEAPLRMAESIATAYNGEDIIVIDCITLLVTNVILGRNELIEDKSFEEAEKATMMEIDSLIDYMDTVSSEFIIVSNEVGLGLVPENRLGREFRDLLGRANQKLASYCDTVFLMVAGIPVVIKQNESQH